MNVAPMTRPVVLNTRPRLQAAELSRLLRAAGFEVLEAPAIEVVAAWDAAELNLTRQRVKMGGYAWLVLSSQNAARFLQNAVGELDGARVLCGTSTAFALKLTGATTLDRYSASAALGVLGHELKPGERVLVPRAADGREELVDGLAALGISLDAPVCYRTQPVPVSLPPGQPLAAITLCSPSVVNSLVDSIGITAMQQSALICLGDTTADAARASGLRVDGVATRTSMPALVEAVRAALAVSKVAI
jgi:uroporphyrinogen-III synthase